MTEAVRALLARKRQERKDEWEHGQVLTLGADSQALLNAAAIGECQGYKFVQELTHEQYETEIRDD